MSYTSFRRAVWAHYRTDGRHDLLWRKTRDPYRILVSELMLQQTQVERVVPFYKQFLARFPSARALAQAPLRDVLLLWQGLGYNRRAKMLHETAKEIALRGMPRDIEGLRALPGVGPYTAGAIAAFAYGADGIFVETNIRTAVLSHFFPRTKKVSDAQIMRVLARARPKGKSREWNYALMDYGAYLKRSGVRLNAKSVHYTKQSGFAGSLRQARGAVLRELAKGASSEARLLGLLGDDRAPQLAAALRALCAEGLVRKRGRVFTLPR